MKMKEKIKRALESVRSITDFKPRVALVLGSGLGAFADTEMDVRVKIDYADIEGFPVSTVVGHSGKLIFGYVGDVPVAAMQGRVHYYEGNSTEDTVLPLRVLRLLGCEILFLTNAAGGINPNYPAGSFMLIRDHISCLVPSPLRGENLDELGLRFPDMSKVYDEELSSIIVQSAKEYGIFLGEGVYIQTTGPQYETPAEIRMYRAWGADAVGMSTACEAIAARHASYRVCGISLITNAAAGMSQEKLTHEEVKETADRAAKNFSLLVSAAIKKMGNLS